MKICTIIPPEIKDGFGATQSLGTKVTCDDGEIHNITKMQITLEPGGSIRAQIELLPTFKKMEGVESYFVMEHPFTGKLVEVSQLVLGNGTTVDL